MDHGAHMEMPTPTSVGSIVATITGAAAHATTPAAMSSSGGGHGSMGYTPGTCRISMLWNWYTIDSCFIARSWHNKTRAHFAGTCIGVVLICMLLELVRRAQREYDRSIVREWEVQRANQCGAATTECSSSNAEEAAAGKSGALVLGKSLVSPLTFRPTLLQQAVRAGFYVVQFWAAYLIMLLAMYYNGYVIISILIGVFLGHFMFGYDNIVIGGKQETGTSCC